jgi:pilus assembly protein CpaB
VLEDAIVLATGHQIEPDPEGKPSDVTIVTLLLTPEQSQRAVLASAQGAIHFVLRNFGDSSRTGETITLLSELSGPPQPMQHAVIRPAIPQPQAVPRRHEIEIVLAGEVSGSLSTRPAAPQDRGHQQ